MAYSVITYPGTAGFGPYPVAFTLGNLRDEYVTCRVNEEEDGFGQPVYRSIEWTIPGFATITSGTEPVTSDSVVFQRTMPVTKLIHDYSNGAVIDEINLDESNLQLIMLVHQFLDGRLPAPFSTNLNMGNNRIINLADAIDPNDAVNRQQLEDFTGNAPAYAAQAAVSAAEALNTLGDVQDVYSDTVDLRDSVTQMKTDVETLHGEVEDYVENIPMDNKTATTSPTVSDDVSAGYVVGSRWFDISVTPAECYICMDNTLGAAVWVVITFDAEDINPLLNAKQNKLTPPKTVALSYTLVLADDGGQLISPQNSAGAAVITIPDNTTAIPIGTTIPFWWRYSANTSVTFVGASGVTITLAAGYAAKLRSQYSTAAITKTGASSWLLVGDLEYA